MVGKLVVVMGIDGSGKTTLINNIKQCSENIPRIKPMSIFKDSVFTRELEQVAELNGKTRREMYSPILRSIVWRNDLINNTLLKVVPELENGNIVILDRYYLCNKIYSNFDVQNLSHMDKLFEILPKPDLGLYLDVKVDIALDRIEKRGLKKSPYETKENLNKLRNKYLEHIVQEQYPILKIDANLSEKEVLRIALDKIFEILYKNQSEERESNGRNI